MRPGLVHGVVPGCAPDAGREQRRWPSHSAGRGMRGARLLDDVLPGKRKKVAAPPGTHPGVPARRPDPMPTRTNRHPGRSSLPLIQPSSKAAS